MVEETTFRRLRHALLELLRGYPSYRFFGKIESYLPESKYSLQTLKEDGIIEFAPKEESQALNKELTEEQWAQLRAEGKKEPIWYRLSPNGINLAISMINLDHAQETRKFTIAVIVLTVLTFLLGINQLVLAYLQNPIF